MPRDNAYYGAAADYFAQRAEQGVWNAFIDRPAMKELIGDVAGQRVLDAGCGAGHHSAYLLDGGAQVLGLERSVDLLRHARTRLGGRAELRQHDLNEPLTFLPNESFDGTICALVIHHLQSRMAFLREVYRVLRPGGWLALSTTHPTSDWRHFGGSYFSQDWVTSEVADGQHAIRYQRMTLQTLLDEVISAGFTLERLMEPRPSELLKVPSPAAFEELDVQPSLLAVLLRRSDGSS